MSRKRVEARARRRAIQWARSRLVLAAGAFGFSSSPIADRLWSAVMLQFVQEVCAANGLPPPRVPRSLRRYLP